MKRNTRVDKPQRWEQEPFSRQLTEARKENRRLEDDCKARVESIERKAGIKIDVACVERDEAIKVMDVMTKRRKLYNDMHRDFARVAPVLRSRSFFRRLWWGLRFAAWGVFGYEVAPGPDSPETLKDRLHTIFRSAEAAGIELGDNPDYDICKSFRKASA